jgi:hypothetical protein
MLVCAGGVALSGCVLVPFVQAFKKSGVAESDRMALLPGEVKKFSEGLQWGNKMQALTVVTDDARPVLSEQLRAVPEDERVVESKIDDVAWSESAYKAKVSLKVKYFRAPFFVVKTRIEEQNWRFSLADGWKLTDRSLLDG